MQRKKLLALPIDKARADIPVMQAIEEEKNGTYIRTRFNYAYDAFVYKSTGEEVLIVDMFTPAPGAKFKYRLFMTADKWFTVFPDGRTSEVSLFRTVEGYWCNCRYYPFSDRTDTVIAEYIESCDRYAVHYDKGGMENISLWQDRIRDRRLKAKYDRIKESTSFEMREIRPLPKAFYDFINNTVMADSYYIFYDYSNKKQTTGRCSECDEEAIIPRVKRGDTVRCPHCKKLCKALPRKAYRNTNGFNRFTQAVYLQPFKKDRFCARRFDINWTFCQNEQPKKSITEVERTIVEFKYNSLNICSEYFLDESYRGGEWRRGNRCSSSTGWIFPDNLNRIFKERQGFNKYHIDFRRIARTVNPSDYKGINDAVMNVNFFDNLFNNKLINLAKAFITVFGIYGNKSAVSQYNLSAGSLRKGMGITKDDLPYLRKINPTLNQLDLYFSYKKSGRRFNEEEFTEFLHIATLTNAGEKFMKMILSHSSLMQFNKFFRKWESENCGPAEEYAYRWLDSRRDFPGDYEDYIKYAELLEYDLNNLDVLYPRNFRKAHDEAYKIVNDKEFKGSELPQIARQYAGYKKLYGFEDKDFIITPPTRHNDIKDEGKQLKHCVATYARSVATAKTIILFIRKKTEPDKPFFTLELNPDTLSIKQCRGLKNCAYPQSVKKFMDKWIKEKIEPIKRSREKCQTVA